MSKAKMWGLLLYWQTGLQDRQCHAHCTLSKTSRCWQDLCFHDKDLAHCLVKQARDYLWLNKLCQIFEKYLPYVQYYFTKTLWNLCQIVDKNLNQQLIQWYIQQIQFWHILAEWSISGKTQINLWNILVTIGFQLLKVRVHSYANTI